MNLMKWKDPFEKKMSLFRKKVNNLFDDFFDSSDKSLATFLDNEVPKVNFSESKDSYEVSAELPGMNENDFDVSLNDNILTIKGEKKSEKEDKGKHYHTVERTYGSFARSVSIPGEIKEDDIKAKFKNGVLKISLPKMNPGKEKKIKVNID